MKRNKNQNRQPQKFSFTINPQELAIYTNTFQRAEVQECSIEAALIEFDEKLAYLLLKKIGKEKFTQVVVSLIKNKQFCNTVIHSNDPKLFTWLQNNIEIHPSKFGRENLDLLQLAASQGANKVVEYIYENKIIDLNKKYAVTPIQYAVSHYLESNCNGYVKVVEFLAKQKNVNVNQLMSSGESLLHVSIASGFPQKTLIKIKVDKNIKFKTVFKLTHSNVTNELTYNELGSLFKKLGYIPERSIPGKILSKEDLIFMDGQNKLNKATLCETKEVRTQCFADAIELFKTILNNDKIRISLAFEYLITIQKICNHKELESYIIDKATFLNNLPVLTAVYTNAVTKCLDNVDLKNAFVYATKAHALLEEITNKQDKGNILYNLALCLRDINPEKALEFLELAEKYIPNDIDIQIVKEYLQNFLKLADKIESNCRVIIKLHKTSITEEPELTNKKNIVHKLIEEISILQNNSFTSWHTEGLLLVEKFIEENKFLKEAQNSTLQYLLFVIYNQNLRDKEASLALNKFADILSYVPEKYQEPHSHLISLFTNALNICLASDFEQGDFSLSKAILKKVKNVKLPKDFFEYMDSVIYFAEKLFAKNENVIEIEEHVNQAQTQKKPNKPEFSKIETNKKDSKEELGGKKVNKEAPIKLTYHEIKLIIDSGHGASLDATSWDTYFQVQKKISLSKGINTTSDKQKCFSWEIENKNYKTKIEQEGDIIVTKINKFHEYNLNIENYYVAIDPKILEQLTKLQKIEMCQNALSEHVKIIKNNKNHSIIELWIKDDLRLVTHNLYKDSDGKYLIIFDKISNHEKVKKSLKSLNIIELDKDILILSDTENKPNEVITYNNFINSDEVNINGADSSDEE